MNFDRLMETYYPVIIPLFWFLLSALIARASGWKALAEAYPLQSDPTGTKLRFQSATLRWSSNYTGLVQIGCDSQGLYLSIFLLFRIGHPPMFIPWGDIRTESRGGLVPGLTLRFSRKPGVPFTISRALGEKLAAMSGGRFKIS
jgi:hypothetical protein